MPIAFFVYSVYIAFNLKTMTKRTLSIKVDDKTREALEREAGKKEWSLSYYVQSLLKNYVKRNRLA